MICDCRPQPGFGRHNTEQPDHSRCRSDTVGTAIPRIPTDQTTQTRAAGCAEPDLPHPFARTAATPPGKSTEFGGHHTGVRGTSYGFLDAATRYLLLAELVSEERNGDNKKHFVSPESLKPIRPTRALSNRAVDRLIGSPSPIVRRRPTTVCRLSKGTIRGSAAWRPEDARRGSRSRIRPKRAVR